MCQPYKIVIYFCYGCATICSILRYRVILRRKEGEEAVVLPEGKRTRLGRVCVNYCFGSDRRHRNSNFAWFPCHRCLLSDRQRSELHLIAARTGRFVTG